MADPVPVIAAIKVPICNHADPALWFKMCESTFELGTPKPITESKTKYNYCVAHLPPETASLVRDVLMNPDTEDTYKMLKDTLIQRSGESSHQEIRKLLQGEHIGDRKPTELLRVLKRRAETHKVPDKLMLELFLQHLPSHVQTVLAAVTSLELDQAAEIADRVMEVSPISEDEPDGHVSFYVHHSIESSNLSPVYTPRGIITYFPSRNEATYSDEKSLTNVDIEKLKKLSESDGIYRIKISTTPDEDAVFSFTKACAIYESGLTDTITVALDQSGVLYGIAISAIPASCIGSQVPTSKLLGFNTSINFVALANGPSPDTLTYIQRLDQEKAEKARGEQGDNRSFLAKYWMYIIPFVIFVFISGAGNPEGQGGGR